MIEDHSLQLFYDANLLQFAKNPKLTKNDAIVKWVLNS